MKTQKQTLESREKEFIKLLEAKEERAMQVFNLLQTYYFIDDLINNRNHTKLINDIYVKKSRLPKWSQANDCNVGQRTAFRYRHVYIWLIEKLLDFTVQNEFALTLI